jgi:hypothetical protein
VPYVSLEDVKHKILEKKLLYLIIFWVRVCVPKYAMIAKSNGPTPFSLSCHEWFMLATFSIAISISCNFLYANNQNVFS